MPSLRLDSTPYEAPPDAEHAWARRLHIHINRTPRQRQRDRARRRTLRPSSTVRVETLDSPTQYTRAQIERAGRVAAMFTLGTLVLCERPARESLDIDDGSR